MKIPKSLSLIPKYEAPSSWWEHVPVAHMLIELIKPSVVVELGSHYGVSFFSLCESAERFSPDTCVYAIDSWEGDEHAGYYGGSIYEHVKKYRDWHHKQNGVLIREYFDKACEKFENKSIDIIHIDGLHTYEAVKADYEMWKEKLKENGTFLFHDWNVKDDNFGVWKLWEELKATGEYKVIEFTNGYGLGIATKSNNKPDWHDTLQEYKEQLVTKGILLERIHSLNSKNQAQSAELKLLTEHLENLKVMNMDKQKQIEEADFRTRELLNEHKEVKELLGEHEKKKRGNFFNLYNRIKPKK